MESVSELENLFEEGGANALSVFWRLWMTRHHRCSVEELIGSWARGQHPTQNQHTEGKLAPIEEFALVLRWLRGGWTRHVELADWLDLEEDHVGIILHNGVILTATFFAPRFFARNASVLSRKTIIEQHTPVEWRKKFSILHSNSPSLILVSDNTELPCQHSGELPFASMLYSGKQEDYTVKWLPLVTANGIVVERSWVFGGRTEEVLTLQHVLDNSEYLKQLCRDGVRLVLDRGFSRMSETDTIHIVMPPFLNGRRTFTIAEAIIGQVQCTATSNPSDK